MSKNIQPKMWKRNKESVKSKSLRNEKRLSEKLGFTLTPGSGNQPWLSKKGDGDHPFFKFELKETEKANISIGPNAIRKINRESKLVGKEPIIILSAYGIPEPAPKEWACVPLDVFQGLLIAYEAYNEFR